MKKIILAMFAIIIILNISSCKTEYQEDEIHSINDALKISAWVLNEDLDENGSWTIYENIRGGSWTESDGRIFDSNEDDIFALERLKLNEVRTMAPFNFMEMYNLNIHIEYDGMIGVESEDEYIRLMYSGKPPTEWSGWLEGSNNMPSSLYVNICPLDEYPSGIGVRNDIQRTKREYYLNVNAYKSVGAAIEELPTIRARLKLVVLEDKGLPSKHDSLGNYVGVEMSRFMSIELVSYEYSDIYKILEDISDEEDD